MNKNGLSLVEVLIAITIIAFIGTIATTIVTRIFRTTSQSADISRLKENGGRAINSIAETIRMADKVVCYGATSYNNNDFSCYGSTGSKNSIIVIRTLAGKFVKFNFVDPVIGAGCKVTQNGYVTRQDNLDPAGFTSDQSFCSINIGSPAPVILTDINSFSGVSIRNGDFHKFSGTENKDTVSIFFNVNPAFSVGGSGSLDTATMQTTVQVR